MNVSNNKRSFDWFIEINSNDKISACQISLKEYDAERLGYYDQEKWKSVFENKLPSIADKLNARLI